jgi:hypothetical protein
MSTWRITYRGRADISEEIITADELVDNGEWVDFVVDSEATSEKVLRVRASDVVEIRTVAPQS